MDRIFRGHAEDRDSNVLVSGKRQRQVNSDGQERPLTGNSHDWSGQGENFALETADGEEPEVSAVGGRSDLRRKQKDPQDWQRHKKSKSNRYIIQV